MIYIVEDVKNPWQVIRNKSSEHWTLYSTNDRNNQIVRLCFYKKSSTTHKSYRKLMNQRGVGNLSRCHSKTARDIGSDVHEGI